MKTFDRRDFLKLGGAAAALSAAGCATTGAKARVVVIGGGFGGATAAKYIRLWDPAIEVVLVEREEAFTSCPISNLVLGGFTGMDTVRHGYGGLQRYGVQVVRDEAVAVDPAKKTVRLRRGGDLAYDRLVVSPGIDFTYGDVQGYEAAMQSGRVLHAWKAGAQTVALRRQLEDMRDGGVYILSIPTAPYRCPPGPYERASVVAAYFKAAKPRSKVLVLDANPEVQSKPALFRKVWAEQYAGMVEYRPQHKALAVDAAARTVRFELADDVRADVLNVLPAMRAGALAVQSGLANSNARWCQVHWLDFESTAAKDIHVVGDAIQLASLMPKSGHMANNQAKVAAAAIVAELSGWAPDPAPMLGNTCYSFVDATRVIHVASVHRYDAAEKTFRAVPGAGGVSGAPSEQEGVYAWNWARTAWADALS